MFPLFVPLFWMFAFQTAHICGLIFDFFSSFDMPKHTRQKPIVAQEMLKVQQSPGNTAEK